MPDEQGYSNKDYQNEGKVPPQFRNGAKYYGGRTKPLPAPDKDGIIRREPLMVDDE